MDSWSENFKEARMWAVICHLCGLLAFTPIPIACLIAPLIIWLVKKDQYAFVDRQGREVLNFHISILIYGVVAFVLAFFVLRFPLLFLQFIFFLALFHLIFTILAAVRVYDGVPYRYPLTIRFL